MGSSSASTRGKRTHETNDLNFGHFGAWKYDSAEEAWSSLRQGLPRGRNEIPILNFLNMAELHEKSQNHGRSATVIADTPPKRPLRLFKPYQAALGRSCNADTSAVNEPSAQSSSIFCHAHGPYEQDSHVSLLPVFLYRSRLDSASLAIHPIRSRNALELRRAIPELGSNACIVPAPCRGSILGITGSPEKDNIAIRQGTASTICRVHVSTQKRSTDGSGTVFELEVVASIPISRTGGCAHAHVAFDPSNSGKIGIVDERGNWSVWKLKGKRNQSARLLMSAHLQASGRLLAVTTATISTAIHPVEGWHRICWLEIEEPDIRLLLVCNRQNARVFDISGNLLSDVDVRLGQTAAQNRFLDVQHSGIDRSICYILTGSRILAMQLTKPETGAAKLEVVCSWVHFLNGQNGNLAMSVIESHDLRCVVIHDGYQSPQLFCMKVSPLQGLVAVGDRASLQASSELDETRFTAVSALQLVELPPRRRARHPAPSDFFVKLVACDANEKLLDITFELGSDVAHDSSVGDVSGTGTTALYLGQDEDWHFASSRRIDYGEGLSDQVIPDDADLELGVEQHLIQRVLPEIHDRAAKEWKDILQDTISASGTKAAEEAFQDVQHFATDTDRKHEVRQVAAELMSDVHIADLQSFSQRLDVWAEQSADGSRPAPAVPSYRSRDASSKALVDEHEELLNEFVEPLSRDLPDRVRVQSERIARQVALDGWMSSVVLGDTAPQQGDVEMVQTKQESPSPEEGHAESKHDNDLYTALRRHTNFNVPMSTSTSQATASRIMAHLPTGLSDPISYSYHDIETDLREHQTQEELASFPENERRKLERAQIRKEQRLAQLQRRRDAIQSQDFSVPGLNVLDPREVQSSQLVPDINGTSQAVPMPMTQPERGPHGERKLLKSKGGKRRKGF
ncbi:uncharacterized protein AB675_5612 [Cyphellophora attinorum]|uniref:RNA polymerase I-specific transcription initiation factor RRN6 n=1 Tax=Cyphellophora attinorum TaxID=1664694 RepID=A0A0N1P066_9EURO|nr:uncharacterized protein AB675_5612 [Phialophora attinorum]KPI42196.1 hypothetical protein AB675_5612 [Phialophora attinorum]